MIYVGRDPSEMKKLLSRIPTRCIVARKSESDFGFAVTNGKNIKYKMLMKVLKLYNYTPATYTYVRGTMSVVALRDDKESDDVKGGIIELRIFTGESPDELPKESKMKKTADVSKIKVIENEEIPNGYMLEFKDSVPSNSKDKSKTP